MRRPGAVVFIAHDRVTHLVINHVFQKPRGDEIAVEERVDADEPVFLLDGGEDDAVARAPGAFAAPDDRVAPQAVAEIPGVQFVEQRAEVEKTPLREFWKVELPLHGQVCGDSLALRTSALSDGRFACDWNAFFGSHRPI